MACPPLIRLEQFSRYSPQQIGSVAHAFDELLHNGIPLPEMMVIPRETLSQLAHETGLTSELKALSTADPDTLKKSVVHFTQRVTLPEWFTDALLSSYHQTFQRGFVRIISGETFFSFPFRRAEHIQGDANLLESIRDVWSEMILQMLKEQAYAPHHLASQVPFILQEQAQPIASGTAVTFGQDGSSTSITIRAIWGCPHQQLLTEAADTYSVNATSGIVTQRSIAKKTVQYHRATDRLEADTIPFRFQSHAVISDEQCGIIASLLQRIKRLHLKHQEISWELSETGLEITNLRDSERTTVETYKKQGQRSGVTKLYISAGNPFKRQTQVSEHIDGVGVLRSEFTIASFGIHPLHLAQTRQKRALTKELSRTITAYQEVLHDKLVLYRLQNFTSAELGRLQYGSSYEPEEANPYIGSRGAGRYLHLPALLEIEAQAVKEVLSQSKSPLGILIPFVRSAGELQFIIERLTSWGFFRYSHFQLWLQLNTPDAVLNLSQYPLEKVSGVSLNATSLHALLLGIDPDSPELVDRYRSETKSLELLMEEAATQARQIKTERAQFLHLNLHVEDYSEHLVTKAVELGYHGVVVKPQAAPLAHAAVLAAEEKKLWQ